MSDEITAPRLTNPSEHVEAIHPAWEPLIRASLGRSHDPAAESIRRAARLALAGEPPDEEGIRSIQRDYAKDSDDRRCARAVLAETLHHVATSEVSGDRANYAALGAASLVAFFDYHPTISEPQTIMAVDPLTGTSTPIGTRAYRPDGTLSPRDSLGETALSAIERSRERVISLANRKALSTEVRAFVSRVRDGVVLENGNARFAQRLNALLDRLERVGDPATDEARAAPAPRLRVFDAERRFDLDGKSFQFGNATEAWRDFMKLVKKRESEPDGGWTKLATPQRDDSAEGRRQREKKQREILRDKLKRIDAPRELLQSDRKGRIRLLPVPVLA